MKRFFTICLAGSLIAGVVWGASSSNAEVSAGSAAAKSTAPPYSDPNGNTHVVCTDDATQSYELYIPLSAPKTSSPILYGFDPSGNGKNTLLLLAAGAAANGWILAVSNNSMNGAWSDIFTAQDAVLKDTEEHLSLDPTRRFAAGMSGGARTSLALAFRYPAKICGTLCLGAGWPVNTDLEPSTNTLIVYMIIGTQDSNYEYDIPETQGELASDGIRCVVETFNGGHVWPPANMVLAGCQWLNANAQKDPNSGLPRATCPDGSLFCQLPPDPNNGWQSYLSDTVDKESMLDNFQGLHAPITRIEWWGVTAEYNSEAGYWIPCDPGSDVFTVSLLANNGGVPGAVVHTETMTATRTDLPLLYSRNYPLRHYSVSLSAPVTLASGWVEIEQVSNSDATTLWLDSPTGDGQSLSYSETGGAFTVEPDDLAVSLTGPSVDFGVDPVRGKPPLKADFVGRVTGNAGKTSDWRWDFGDGSTALEGNVPNPTHTYQNTGTYTVSASVTSVAGSATKTRQNLVIVTQSLPLTSPGILCVLMMLIGVVGVMREGGTKTYL